MNGENKESRGNIDNMDNIDNIDSMVKINYEYYSGSDLYLDGSEDTLLDIVTNYTKEEYSSVIEEKKDWAILYHLSEVRGNIVSFLPITKEDDVLEIGAGCGAITGTLADMARSVDCIELSKKRSLVNAVRNKEYDNITINVGNFQDIEPNIEKKYDYITLIGVLEYAASYIAAKEPYVEFLKIIKKHLKEDGKLIIAIENKYGLKYFAGCREDHLATFFSGIEGYMNCDSVRTFSKNGLEKLSKDAGYKDIEFYYPYPDYKLPLAIYSDDFLPEAGELNVNLRNFDSDRMLLFDESNAFDNIISDGMFDFFSNSFLVLIG